MPGSEPLRRFPLCALCGPMCVCLCVRDQMGVRPVVSVPCQHQQPQCIMAASLCMIQAHCLALAGHTNTVARWTVTFTLLLFLFYKIWCHSRSKIHIYCHCWVSKLKVGECFLVLCILKWVCVFLWCLFVSLIVVSSSFHVVHVGKFLARILEETLAVHFTHQSLTCPSPPPPPVTERAHCS